MYVYIYIYIYIIFICEYVYVCVCVYTHTHMAEQLLVCIKNNAHNYKETMKALVEIIMGKEYSK